MIRMSRRMVGFVSIGAGSLVLAYELWRLYSAYRLVGSIGGQAPIVELQGPPIVLLASLAVLVFGILLVLPRKKRDTRTQQ